LLLIEEVHHPSGVHGYSKSPQSPPEAGDLLQIVLQ